MSKSKANTFELTELEQKFIQQAQNSKIEVDLNITALEILDQRGTEIEVVLSQEKTRNTEYIKNLEKTLNLLESQVKHIEVLEKTIDITREDLDQQRSKGCCKCALKK
jgi:hypothetical protein